MTLPPFFSGAILLFWGWQTGLILFALLMACILEGSRYVPTKWDLSSSDFNRLTDICTILLAGLAVFLLTTDTARVAMNVLKWLPAICFPLFAAQEYSLAGKIDIRALMLLARNKAVAADNRPRTIEISAPYAALCLLAAGTGNIKDGSFFIGVLLFTAWALWPQRSKRFSPFLWLLLLALIGGTGYAGHIGLYHLQKVAMRMATNWWFSGNNSDPFKRSTSMGDIGELKLSDKIIFRVTPEDKPFQPVLLRESTYNLYRGTTWHASPAQFTDISPASDQTTWNLQNNPGTGRSFTVWTRLNNDQGMLKLPLGAYRLANLPVSRLKKTPLGAIKVEEGPGLIGYQVSYNSGTTGDSPPSEKDLIVPPEELPAIQQVMEALHLQSRKPEKIPTVLADFFQNQFNYSLKLRAAEQGSTSLTTFLLSSRAGHCEYFATATVLLLRACGIPARYATGWSAHEESTLGNQIVVRARHAHAWTLVYMDGRWHNLDTTSSSWIELEDDAASDMRFFQDAWSFMIFKFSQWRWGTEEGVLKRWWWILLLPLMIILAKRLRAGREIRRVRTDTEKKIAQRQQEKSPFYRIEQRLNELGFERNPWEPPLCWIQRMRPTDSLKILPDSLHSCLRLYYQGRFGKKGLTPPQQAQLEKEVDAVLKGLQGELWTKDTSSPSLKR